MRLTCPNCDAKYEVPDEVVPEAGRDVQCSNCGQTWFQYHPDHMPDEEQDQVDATPAPDEEVAPPPPPPPPVTEPVRRQLDPAVADVLRQEAEAEYEARRQRQSEPLETQPDLGLPAGDVEDDFEPVDEAADEADQRALEAKRRMARMRGEAEPAAGAAAGASAAAQARRRELLPDIEEINSTLRREEKRGASDADAHGDVEAVYEEKRRRSGFRTGFLLIILIAVIMALVYLYAPQISAQVPQAEPYVSSYVSWIDQMRVLLDVQVQRLLGWLDSVASQSAN